MNLQEQVALVTGGSRGIGRAIVEALVKEGAKVAFTYRGSQQAAEELAANITAAGGSAMPLQGDVADPACAPAHVEKVIADFGQIDVLVNCAGVIKDGLFMQMETDDWQTVINTNLNGTFHYCRAVVQPMMSRRSGRIINVSSIAADHHNAGQCNYAASKGAVNSFTRGLAVEIGRRGITVNAVAPGFIETDMSQAVLNKAGDFIQKKLVPMRRLGKPEDIAGVVAFLASPAAAYITGQVITVDGGLSLGAVSA